MGLAMGLMRGGRAVLAELFKAWGKDRVILFASHDWDLVEGGGGMDVAALR